MLTHTHAGHVAIILELPSQLTAVSLFPRIVSNGSVISNLFSASKTGAGSEGKQEDEQKETGELEGSQTSFHVLSPRFWSALVLSHTKIKVIMRSVCSADSVGSQECHQHRQNMKCASINKHQNFDSNMCLFL